MALFQNFFRNIEAINPFDREDEEERKRKEQIQQNLSRLFRRGAEKVEEFRTAREEAPLISRKSAVNLFKDIAFGTKEQQEDRKKVREIQKKSGFSPFLLSTSKQKEKLSKEEQKLVRKVEEETLMGLGFGFATGVSKVGAPLKDKLVKSVAKKFKLLPEEAVQKVATGATPFLKSVRRQIEKKGLEVAKPPDLFQQIPSFDRASKNISSKIETEPAKKGFLSSYKDFWKNFKSTMVDSFSPVEDAINLAEKKGKYKLLPTQNPVYLRDQVFGAVDIADSSLEKDLVPVLKTIGKNNLDEFDQYLAARLEMDLANQGFKTAIDPKDAKIFVNNLSPKYEAAANQITGYTRTVLSYVRDAGLISDDTFNVLQKKIPKLCAFTKGDG